MPRCPVTKHCEIPLLWHTWHLPPASPELCGQPRNTSSPGQSYRTQPWNACGCSSEGSCLHPSVPPAHSWTLGVTILLRHLLQPGWDTGILTVRQHSLLKEHPSAAVTISSASAGSNPQQSNINPTVRALLLLLHTQSFSHQHPLVPAAVQELPPSIPTPFLMGQRAFHLAHPILTIRRKSLQITITGKHKPILHQECRPPERSSPGDNSLLTSSCLPVQTGLWCTRQYSHFTSLFCAR